MKRLLWLAMFWAATGFAHSASDAYLTLNVAGDGRIEAQWDVALRDLDFVVGLDDDGDGNLTWGEVRKHDAQIARYAYDNVRAFGDDKPCAIRPMSQAISRHSDGAYAALFFAIACDGAPRKLVLDYRLFFAVDPSHRGIVVIKSPRGTATSLAVPDNTRIEIALPVR